MRFAFATLNVVAAAVFALAQPQARAIKKINPDVNSIPGVESWSNVLPSVPVEPKTNAKRFAMKLPPLAPRAHRYPQRAAPHRLGTRVQAAPRTQASPRPPINLNCNILVTSRSQNYGYLSPNFNEFGEYGLFQPGRAGALEVSFSYSRDSPNQLDGTVANGPTATFPYLAASVGFASNDSSLGPGDPDYLFVVGTTQAPPGSPPVVGANSFSVATGAGSVEYESAIWKLELETLYITAEWVNPDGVVPKTSFVYADDENQALVITGDAEAFRDNFDVTYPDVKLACAPIPDQPSRH
ncbi:hypothetical protein FRC12_003072 [Ceratobasidium sp. 428]|nr:hypothetical protein FRC12_003072 [Ceratobasidium sp. 428]